MISRRDQHILRVVRWALFAAEVYETEGTIQHILKIQGKTGNDFVIPIIDNYPIVRGENI